MTTPPLVTPFYIPWGWLGLGAVVLIAGICVYVIYKRKAGRGSWAVDAAAAISATVLAVGVALYVIGSWYTGNWSLETFKQAPADPASLPWGDLSRVATPAVTLRRRSRRRRPSRPRSRRTPG